MISVFPLGGWMDGWRGAEEKGLSSSEGTGSGPAEAAGLHLTPD